MVNTVSNVSQGFSSMCLWLNASLRLAASSSSTCTSMVSPTFTNSEGCLIFFVQLKSDTCTSPSIPSSSSMNKPKLVKLRTIPLCLVPTAYLLSTSCLVQGSSVSCLMPNDILRSSRSIVNTTASSSSPTLMKSCGLRKCCDQLISDTWIK